MTHTVTVRQPGHLLALVPRVLGYRPRESVVVLGVGRDGAVVTALRVDRAELVDAQSGPDTARSMCGALARSDAESAVVVSYTSADIRESCAATETVVGALEPAMLRTDSWAVVDNKFFAPGCFGPCCPARGTALPAPRVALATGDGAEVDVARVGWTATASAPPPLAADRRRARRAGLRWWARRDSSVPEWRARSWEKWARAVRDGTPDTLELGKLGASIRDVAIRDAVILSAFGDGDPLARMVATGTDDGAAERALASITDRNRCARPDPDRASAIEVVTSEVAGHSTGPGAAAAWEILAFLRWWAGDEGAAATAVGMATAASLDATLAPLIGQAIDRGLRPGWTYRDESGKAT